MRYIANGVAVTYFAGMVPDLDGDLDERKSSDDEYCELEAGEKP